MSFDMMGMMAKLKEAQANVEEAKKRLDTISVQEKSSNDLLKVTITGNREIKNIEVAEELLKDKEQLEDYLIITLNKAIKSASKINEDELGSAARQGMPNIPGM